MRENLQGQLTRFRLLHLCAAIDNSQEHVDEAANTQRVLPRERVYDVVVSLRTAESGNRIRIQSGCGVAAGGQARRPATRSQDQTGKRNRLRKGSLLCG